jgi:hypothetical protein
MAFTELTPSQKCLFEIVRQAGNTGVPAERLIIALWDDDEPEHAAKTIHVHIYYANQRLKYHGYKIQAGNGEDRNYRLIRLPPLPRTRMRGRHMWAY